MPDFAKRSDALHVYGARWILPEARINQMEGVLYVDFDGREVEYPFGEFDTLIPAYATTIHKSQGSEYPAVVITLATQHYTMLARNLVYTAVTRGTRLVVIVGPRRALAIALRTHGAKRRWTKLKEWLLPEGGGIRLALDARSFFKQVGVRSGSNKNDKSEFAGVVNLARRSPGPRHRRLN